MLLLSSQQAGTTLHLDLGGRTSPNCRTIEAFLRVCPGCAWGMGWVLRVQGWSVGTRMVRCTIARYPDSCLLSRMRLTSGTS